MSGGILRVAQRSDPYARIPRNTVDLLASRGQLAALGVLVWILGHGDSWEIRVGAMRRQLGLGEARWASIRSAMVDAGLLRQECYQGDGGRWVWVHTVTDEPVLERETVPGFSGHGASVPGKPGDISTTDSRMTDVRMTEHTNARVSALAAADAAVCGGSASRGGTAQEPKGQRPGRAPKQEHAEGGGPRKPSPSARPARGRLETASKSFEAFWAVWPAGHRRRRADAKRTWVSKNLDALADKIVADVQERRRRDRHWLNGFVPGPANYLREGRWEDDITPPSRCRLVVECGSGSMGITA